mgnify:CR=1 FL=1
MNSVQISFNKSSNKFSCVINGNKFTTGKQDYIEYMYKKITGEKKTFAEIAGEKKESKAEKFNINERFEFVENLVNMIATGLQPSAVITGEGGLGKTYTALALARDAGTCVVAAPASLRQMWREAAAAARVPVTFVSLERLSRGVPVPPAGFVIVDEAHDPESSFPWKGNIDCGKLEAEIKRVGAVSARFRLHDPQQGPA